MKERKFVLASAISGNVLEYYDFTVYVVFSSVIAKTFFPSDNEHISLMSSLLGFASGFLTRPIGGILFGYIGDNYGRRTSLILSMIGMTVSTFAIGLIPGYNEIGYFAPILLVICRLFQGLCISGEGAGAAIFVLEHYNNMRPGFITGIVHGSNIVGSLIAVCMGIFLNNYFGDSEFSWRFAFIVGGFLGIVGFNMRLKVSETPIFKTLIEKKSKLKLSLITVLQNALPSVLITFLTGAISSSIVYLVKGYINIYFSEIKKLPYDIALWHMNYALVILMISMPISGYFSDIIGKFKMIRLAAFSIILLIFPTLILLSSDSVIIDLFSLTLLASLAGAISGSAYIFVISLFKPSERFSGVAFSYNLGIAIFGGTSPAVSLWLMDKTGVDYSPALYVTLVSLIFLIVTTIYKNKILTIISENETNA